MAMEPFQKNLGGEDSQSPLLHHLGGPAASWEFLSLWKGGGGACYFFLGSKVEAAGKK